MLPPRLRVACLALGLCACATDVGNSDCRSLGCPEPWICVAPGARGRCRSASLGIPSCRGTPAGSFIGLEEAAEGIPLHHVSLSRCVSLTYEPALAPFAEAIEAAVATFNAVPCSRLCYAVEGVSEERTNPDIAERRLHLALEVDDTVSARDRGAVVVFFEFATGRILTCEVDLDTSVLGSFTEADALRAMMSCAGFRSLEVFTPFSVFRPGETMLTADDERALCAMYGTPGYCAEDDVLFP